MKPITAIVLGAGQRGANVYAAYALSFPNELKIVGVAEPRADRRAAFAKEHGIPCQAKEAVAGGNNAGAIHSSRAGVKTLALSVPCRYLHSAACVIDQADLEATRELVELTAAAVAGQA